MSRSQMIRLSFTLVWIVSSVGQAKLVIIEDARERSNTASVPIDAHISAAQAVWIADQGSTLRASLQKWADQAHWTLVWEVPNGVNQQWNYPILVPLTFTGSVEQAVAACISLYEQAEKPLAVQIQPAQKLFYVSLKIS